MAQNDDASNERDRGSWARRHSWRNWNTLERVLAGLAALIAVVTGSVLAFKALTADTPLEKEQALVQKLRPGQTFSRATQIMKEDPHYIMTLPSKNVIHQYDREWEHIQLIVSPDKEVLAVGIYAHDREFQPKVKLGGRTELMLNRDTFSKFGDPNFAFGYCGVHSSAYHEGYYAQGSMPNHTVSVTDPHRGNPTPWGGCAVPLNELDCVRGDFDQEFKTAGPHAECLTAGKAADFRSTLKVNSVVLAVDGALSTDLFQNPYLVSKGN